MTQQSPPPQTRLLEVWGDTVDSRHRVLSIVLGVGLGAPVIGMFAILSTWEHRVFAATMQPFWILLSLSTVVSRQVVAPGGAPRWEWWMWLVAVAPVLVGVVAGERIAARIDQAVARRAVIVFSLLSGLAVLVTGLVGLAS